MAYQKLKVTILGEPISKSNSTIARFNWKKKRSEVFIPEKFMNYEAKIRYEAEEYMRTSGKKAFLDGPVNIEIIYYLGSNRKKDLLNLPKTTCDALNDVFYDDDSQIVEAVCIKRYDKENPRVEITVSRPVKWKQRTNDKYWSLPTSYAKPHLIKKKRVRRGKRTPVKST